MRATCVNPATIIEVVMALALFALISASFLTFMDFLDKANAKTIKQNTAIEVLDNTLERLAAATAPNIKLAGDILQDELARSPLKSASSAVEKTPDGGVELLIRGKRGDKIESIKYGLGARKNSNTTQ